MGGRGGAAGEGGSPGGAGGRAPPNTGGWDVPPTPSPEALGQPCDVVSGCPRDGLGAVGPPQTPGDPTTNGGGGE